MNQEKPIFTSGNKWFVAALNRLSTALWRHGINPAGRPGWSESPDGWIPPIFRGVTGIESKWDLSVANSDAKTFTVSCGRIIADASNLETELEITGKDSTFTAASGNILRLKITGAYDETTVTLECAGEWTDYPSAVELTETGSDAAFLAYYYPLWKFTDSDADGGTILFEGIYARRLVGDFDFLRILTAYSEPGSAPIATPALIPYHAPA